MNTQRQTEGAYIIQKLGRTPPNARYVANAGRKSSYTNLANARRFYSRIEAEGHLCIKNEIIIPI